jgi:radical SAM protein
MRVYWELTRACDLACRHCRAEAMAGRDAGELDTAEAFRFLEALTGFGRPFPHLVLTGGDPLKRPDFWEILERGAAIGLDLSVAPSGTPLLTAEVIHRLKSAGVQAMSLSLDGSDPERHDGLRGVPGTFERTVAIARTAAEAAIPVQINTLATAETRDDLPAIGDLVGQLGAARWSLFFLIQVGRGRVLGPMAAVECERVLEWLWERAGQAPYVITTTEAPHYRRVVLQRMRAAGRRSSEGEPLRRGFGIRDGNGIMFVGHTGEVTPSGFLPLVVGNVRVTSPVTLYRESPLFRALRRPEGFGRRCGRCEYREVCGGSRARAYAATGDPLEDDPLCPYEPLALRGAALAV